MLTPSSKDTTFMTRIPYLEGFEELGMAGRGIVANHDLKSWRFNRQFFNQAVLTPSFNNEAVKWSNKLLQELEGYWESLGKLNLSDNNLQDDKNDWSLEFDISSWSRRFTSDMIVILVTGERSYTMASYYNIYSPVKVTRTGALIEDSERFVQGFSYHLTGFTYFMYLGPIVRHYWPFTRSKVRSFLKNRDYLFETLDMIIKKRRKEIDETPIDKELEHDMLTSLIIANTERNKNRISTGDGITRPMTDVEIRGNLFDAFLGGVDTTANSFSFVTYYVCHHPQVKQKMITEIDSIFSPNTPHNLKYEDLLKLEYCDAIINEVSRMTPVAVDIPRYLEYPSELAGYRWEAGTYFHMNVHGIHNHKDAWSNPEVFDPDRFYKKVVGNSLDNKTMPKFSLIPFGGGLRMCPGRKLAVIELLSLMVMVFGKYDVELIDMKAPLQLDTTGLSICKELPVRIRPRKFSS
ncbi:12239_t:CDS:2 [Cetraspora pellucida]|uniref:12239_t:CDS:1 n=1 Tax=Cetraspora pellucida TaxID=1433469 RepID=A0A9N8VJW8_9GLOM|nr:12239_t:CDS:2 [Cetraspora pellucida]